MSRSAIIKTLVRTLAGEFYRMNSGFFLLFGTVAFGFMSEVEHKALAQFFVSSVPSLMIPLVVWILYMVKIQGYNRGELLLHTHRFLFNIQFLSMSGRIGVCGSLVLAQFLPALAYGVFLAGMAWKQSAYGSIAIIIGGLVVIPAIGTVDMMRYLQRPRREVKVSTFKAFIDRHHVRPAVQFYTEWLLRKFPLLLGATKILTGGLLIGVSILYQHEAVDWRFMTMAVSVCGVANLLLVFHLVSLEHYTLGWTKNLPLRRSARFTRLLIVAAVFVIPECVILVRHFPSHLHVQWAALDVAYLLSLIALNLGVLHTRAAPLEYFTRTVFWLFIAMIILILFKTPLILLILVNFAMGYFLFYRNYYRLEFTSDDGDATRRKKEDVSKLSLSI